MKILVSSYTFSAGSKTVKFNDFTSIDLNRILLVTNVTKNTILYNFADPTAGGTVSGNVLTLSASTAGMSDADSLQIYYYNEQTTSSDDAIIFMRRLFKVLEPLQAITSTGVQRVNADNFNSCFSNTVTQLGVCSQVASVASAPPAPYVSTYPIFTQRNIVDERWDQVLFARTAYAQGLRSNLTWS